MVAPGLADSANGKTAFKNVASCNRVVAAGRSERLPRRQVLSHPWPGRGLLASLIFRPSCLPAQSFETHMRLWCREWSDADRFLGSTTHPAFAIGCAAGR